MKRGKELAVPPDISTFPAFLGVWKQIAEGSSTLMMEWLS